MTFRQFARARQLLSEERMGAAMRDAARAVVAEEDAQYRASVEGLRRQQHELGDL